MGLGAYGQPEHLEFFRKIVHFDEKSYGNGFRLGLDYFTHHRIGPEMSWADADKTPTMGKMFSAEMSRLLGPVRGPDEPLEQRHRNLAASLQARLEEVYLGMLRKLAKNTGMKSVCLAGGVAFNCVANGKIFDHHRIRTGLRASSGRRRRLIRRRERFMCGIRFCSSLALS